MMIRPVILAGGTGSRLWPISRSSYPKQLLSLIGNKTMLQETVLRTQAIENVLSPIVICNEQHRFLIAEQLQEIGIQDGTIILEPIGRNTAPAVAISALYQGKDDPLLLVLPADHVIQDNQVFTNTIDAAVYYAEKGYLVTFGILPTQAETGYGYIKTAQDLNNAQAYLVEMFIEKPDNEMAKTYVASKEYYWNSGIFLFKASQYLAALNQYAPTILEACKKTIINITKDLDFVRLDKNSFNECPSNSIDYAILEKTKNLVLIPLHTTWCDVGSWSALCDIHESDLNGNVLRGDIIIEDVQRSYLRAESRMLAVVGVSDHIIVETADAVLVAHKNKSQAVKNIVSRLKQEHRSEIDLHKQIYRPWGYYEILHKDKRFQVKHITIKSGASLSLQIHRYRSEHWVVVHGTAQVIRGDEVFVISENESTFIQKGMKHRLSNLGLDRLEIIEIQLGDYLGEDDIIRLEDKYGRISECL